MKRTIKSAELKKMENEINRKLAKKYGYRFSHGFIYKKIGDYFVFIINSLGFNRPYGYKYPDETYIDPIYWATSTCHIKPYFADDLFWEVYGMEDLKKQPMSFRAYGVFTTEDYMFTIDYEPGYEPPLDTPKEIVFAGMEEDLDRRMAKMTVELECRVKSFGDDIQNFIDCWKASSKYASWELTEMLYLIKLGRYTDAKNLAESEIAANRHGKFIDWRTAETKYGIYDWVVKYCNEAERQKQEGV